MFCFPLNLILFFYEIKKLRQAFTENQTEQQAMNDEQYARYLQEMENQNFENLENPENQFDNNIPLEIEERESLINNQEIAYQESLQRDIQRV